MTIWRFEYIIKSFFCQNKTNIKISAVNTNYVGITAEIFVDHKTFFFFNETARFITFSLIIFYLLFFPKFAANLFTHKHFQRNTYNKNIFKRSFRRNCLMALKFQNSIREQKFHQIWALQSNYNPLFVDFSLNREKKAHNAIKLKKKKNDSRHNLSATQN